MFTLDSKDDEINHPEFVRGWNARLDGISETNVHPQFHRGWMAACAAAASDQASVLNLLHRAVSLDPSAIISFRPEREPMMAPPKKETVAAPPITHAIVLVGWERLENNPLAPDALENICKNRDCTNIVQFPAGTRFPQIVRALGAFDSASDAKRNGWDTDVPVGLTIRVIRINRVRGQIVVHRI